MSSRKDFLKEKKLRYVLVTKGRDPRSMARFGTKVALSNVRAAFVCSSITNDMEHDEMTLLYMTLDCFLFPFQ